MVDTAMSLFVDLGDQLAPQWSSETHDIWWTLAGIRKELEASISRAEKAADRRSQGVTCDGQQELF
jgi:hypothetical protein